MAKFDAKSEHAKITADAKNKAKKLFGDARERKFAKKKEHDEKEDEEEGVKV